VSHGVFLSALRDAGDLDRGERLAVAVLASVVLSATELEDDDLLRAILRGDTRLDLGAADERRADRDCVTTEEKNFSKGDGVADRARELFDPDLVALRDAILFSACFDDRVAS
jgi:hypothetical protein